MTFSPRRGIGGHLKGNPGFLTQLGQLSAPATVEHPRGPRDRFLNAVPGDSQKGTAGSKSLEGFGHSGMPERLARAAGKFHLSLRSEEQDPRDETTLERQIRGRLHHRFGVAGRRLLPRLLSVQKQLPTGKPRHSCPAEIGPDFQLQHAASLFDRLADLPDGVIQSIAEFTLRHEITPSAQLVASSVIK